LPVSEETAQKGYESYLSDLTCIKEEGTDFRDVEDLVRITGLKPKKTKQVKELFGDVGQMLNRQTGSSQIFRRAGQIPFDAFERFFDISRDPELAEIVQRSLMNSGLYEELKYFMQKSGGLKLSEREAMKRLLTRRRLDDKPSAIRRRFAFFRREVLPVVSYYRKRRRIIIVNGDQSRDKVWRDIKKVLKLK